MKLLIALATVLSISATSAEWTCDDCTAVVNSIAAYLTSEESIAKQVDILLAEVCPVSPAPEECVDGLPAFWNRVAMVLWPGYYSAEEDWMCAPLCMAKAVRDITCEECFQGLQAGVDQLLLEETIQAIVGALSGDAFCGMEEDAERCAQVIETLIPQALPALTANPDEGAGVTICNNAIPDTCPAL
eukprot:TRINITY_DN221_c0_g1_i12.p1 TRINITY_DN221_c0_g1~~TRINITY_DN221_c0_g1_i12.p1  ORF type:complete len:187 (-),score=60.22 TRINITY_DN221_c0_g1_i12:91-651(-)